jgi:hypothetical protein
MWRKFKGPLDPNKTIDHNDRDRSNNHPDNLSQVTQGENNQNKRKKYNKSKKALMEIVMSKIKNKKLTEEDIEKRHPSKKTVTLDKILKLGKLSILEKVKFKLATKSLSKDVIRQVATRLNEYLSLGPKRPRISFGTVSVSMQAGEDLYSIPRSAKGPYSAVELGFPSKRPPPYIMKYMEPFKDDPTKNVYGYVPIELVARWVVEEYGNTEVLEKNLLEKKEI